MRKLLWIFLFSIPASAQAGFNCPSFSTTGACSVSGAASGLTTNFVVRSGGGVVNGAIDFVPANSAHNGYGLWNINKQKIGSFTDTFTFVPNGQNIAFVIQDTNNTPGYQGPYFSSGAGCEGGFFQAFNIGVVPSPNNIVALELDSSSFLNASDSGFTYSSVQLYQANQSPCSPNDGGPGYTAISKISTSPVPLNSPFNKINTTTGDTYSATASYDGTTLTLSLYDVTAGGACPGTACFTHSWPVNIPSLVGDSIAYVGFTSGASGARTLASLPDLLVKTWSFSNSVTPPPPPVYKPQTFTCTPATAPVVVVPSTNSPGFALQANIPTLTCMATQ